MANTVAAPRCIGINQNFEVKFTINRNDLREVIEILDDNEYKHRIEKTRYPAFLLFVVNVNIRKAEVLRRIISGYLKYD